MDDYSIADIATLGWVRNLVGFYEAAEIVGFKDFPQVAAWLERPDFGAQPVADVREG